MRTPQILVALDQTPWKDIESLAGSLAGIPVGMKVGMELFYAHGPRAIEFLSDRGFYVFLDLKLHDIPTTVGKALTNLLAFPAHLFNVHAAGGVEMLEASAQALAKSGRRDAQVIAVTQLTSTSEAVMQSELRIHGSLVDCVVAYAKLAHAAGLGGVVCSAQEAQLVKQATAESFLCVTPGIRPAGVSAHDQKRTMTPRAALENGADALVIGRAITQASDPRLAVEQILKELP
ncbi:MAG: orotidine-5'-phosphate decarboxylase [Bacteriovoracia bacterium]